MLLNILFTFLAMGMSQALLCNSPACIQVGFVQVAAAPLCDAAVHSVLVLKIK
jgi:hypothetical protein